jgi:hypothetical protein
MSKGAYEKIAAGLKEAIAIARAETAPAKMYIGPNKKFIQSGKLSVEYLDLLEKLTR